MANRREKSGNSAFLSSKTTVDADCSHEIKRRLLLRRKAMTNLDSVLKSRDTSLQAKLHVLKVIPFPVYLWELDCKKAQQWRTDALKL